jgi:hypothetical protein
VLGVVVVSVGGRALARFPLRAEAGVDRGGFLRGALDTIILLLRGIHAERLTDAAPPA